MENSELIEKVKNNDSDAFNELLDSFSKMIHYIINSYELSYGDFQINREDLYQEATIALYNACKVFKENNQAKFSTFAYMVIRRRIAHCYKTSRDKYIKESVSIDNLEYIDKSGILSTQVNENNIEYQNTNEFKERIKKPISKLTNEDRQILLMRMENYSYAEIAKKLNITTKRIDNRLNRLRIKYMKNNNKS